jgi:hypothetical protein
MNLRIRQLVEQAGIHFGRSATLDGNNIARFVTTSDMEKFAELLLKDCVSNVKVWEKDSRNHISYMLKNHYDIEV